MAVQTATSFFEEALGELRDARTRSLAVLETFLEHDLRVPHITIANPALWEFGHVIWFSEYWILRRLAGEPPLRPGNDALYDSAKVAHATRWDLPLPTLEETHRYGDDVMRAIERVTADLAPYDLAAMRYFVTLATFHEDMHAEAGLMTAQTLHYRWPILPVEEPEDLGPLPGDVEIPAGRYRVGADEGGKDAEPFVFDNEKWAHDVDLAAFRIARAPVTNAEYAAYLEASGAAPPRDWERASHGGWQRRRFGESVALRPHAPVVNVSRIEAEAYCRFAGRRLPTEDEWEVAATYDFRSGEKRRVPWGSDAPQPRHANLNGRAREPVDVAANPEGDAPSGMRGAIGNVWEWTATTFGPYPGFVRDPYEEYSEPWFGDHVVLRGGAFTTRSRLIRATWRNFYRPERCDPFAGFRTCAA
ncbi:MAG: SUMF1/EgtB/PvdO family nonheme iron enzyme [Candidatus Eremiobacteraeota bacterium]|nr:SUMF1/EgtB/PvdO family nonheme iron enzyme [Candidatus Eremiobacteraeota bacterium]MBV8354634.1 SUMF1/EgtB/PvdO family nonheme iron enzyme [Candidatus Eremiobacteraeota bacterium]